MTTPNIYRSRILNEISESDVGKTIRVAGWVENIRDHGGVRYSIPHYLHDVYNHERHI